MVVPPTHCGIFRPPGANPAGCGVQWFFEPHPFPLCWSTTASYSGKWSITAYPFYREYARTPLPHRLASGPTCRTPQRACHKIRLGSTNGFLDRDGFMVTVAHVWRRSSTARRGIPITRRNPIWKEVVAHILDLDGYAAFRQ